MATSRRSRFGAYVYSVLHSVASFEADELAFAASQFASLGAEAPSDRGQLLPSDLDWLLPWRCAMNHRALVAMWDCDDYGLVVLADELAAFYERHQLWGFMGGEVRRYLRHRTPSAADSLFHELGFC